MLLKASRGKNAMKETLRSNVCFISMFFSFLKPLICASEYCTLISALVGNYCRSSVNETQVPFLQISTNSRLGITVGWCQNSKWIRSKRMEFAKIRCLHSNVQVITNSSYEFRVLKYDIEIIYQSL